MTSQNSETLYVNGEHSLDEMRRRIQAYCLKHGLSEQDISTFDMLGADDWHTQKLSFLRTEKGSSALDQEGLQFLESLLEEIKPDLLILDPLISFCFIRSRP